MKSIIVEEYQRLKELQVMYDKIISQFPKGSVVKKKRGQKYYCYLSYRVNSKVKSDYIGTIDSENVKDLSEKIAERKKYEILRKRVRKIFKKWRGMYMLRSDDIVH